MVMLLGKYWKKYGVLTWEDLISFSKQVKPPKPTKTVANIEDIEDPLEKIEVLLKILEKKITLFLPS